MNIKPYDKTIKDLLISGRQFTIPRFQREYSWDKKNYKEFLDDTIKCLNFIDKNLTTQPYFLGTMLFIGDFTDGASKKIDVVDGQQRLTTITILFSALSDRFIEKNEHVLSRQIFKYIMTTDDNGDDVRVLQSKTHYPFFSYFIQDLNKDNKEDPISEEERNIKETYDFFYNYLNEKNIRAELERKFGKDDVASVTYVDILKAIRDQVLITTFVSISTTDKSQANKIFEILNGKGKKLGYIDLIKNKIFETLSSTEPADFAENKWNNIKKTLNSETETLGIATFFHHFWVSSFEKVTKVSLYDKFNSKFKDSKSSEYEEFLKNLELEAKFYMKIISPKREDYENRKEYFGIVQSLNILSNYFNIVQVRVALLALFSLKEKELIKLKEFKNTVLFLENFHFVYNALMKNRPNKIEGIYSTFSRLVRRENDPSRIIYLINDKLKKPLCKLLPNYDDFKHNFIELTYSKKQNYSNAICKYVLNCSGLDLVVQ